MPLAYIRNRGYIVRVRKSMHQDARVKLPNNINRIRGDRIEQNRS